MIVDNMSNSPEKNNKKSAILLRIEERKKIDICTKIININNKFIENPENKDNKYLKDILIKNQLEAINNWFEGYKNYCHNLKIGDDILYGGASSLKIGEVCKITKGKNNNISSVMIKNDVHGIGKEKIKINGEDYSSIYFNGNTFDKMSFNLKLGFGFDARKAESIIDFKGGQSEELLHSKMLDLYKNKESIITGMLNKSSNGYIIDTIRGKINYHIKINFREKNVPIFNSSGDSYVTLSKINKKNNIHENVILKINEENLLFTQGDMRSSENVKKSFDVKILEFLTKELMENNFYIDNEKLFSAIEKIPEKDTVISRKGNLFSIEDISKRFNSSYSFIDLDGLPIFGGNISYISDKYENNNKEYKFFGFGKYSPKGNDGIYKLGLGIKFIIGENNHHRFYDYNNKNEIFKEIGEYTKNSNVKLDVMENKKINDLYNPEGFTFHLGEKVFNYDKDKILILE